MHNIWAFALQTLAASATAAALLALKALFRRHFSPRWQYGMWAVLAAALLLPARGGGLLFPTLGLHLETLKTAVESSLHSVYSAPYDVTQIGLPIPLPPSQAPGSVTDWLFVLYMVGVVFSLFVSAASYMRLRVSLRQAVPAGPQQLAQVEQVCTLYGLRPCTRTVISARTPTAFICGFVRPILVLPAGGTDDKVILHELLHRKYGDVLSGMVICVLRCLHWCNPLIRYALRRAQADCEALCDQRVLEKLEGEDLREYGRILLSMADSRFSRTPGTSSIANGGRNIRARIESITRFRLYPRDMRLVSGCIAVVMLFSCAGWLQTPLRAWYDYEASVSIAERMTFARLHRAESARDAFFLYAAALERADGCILARVTPLSSHSELAAQLSASGGTLPIDDPPFGHCALYSLREESDSASALLIFESGHCYSLRADKLSDGWIVECLDRWVQNIEAFGFYSANELPPLETYSASTELFDAEVTARYIILADAPEASESSALYDPTLYENGLAEYTFRIGHGLRFRWKGSEAAEISGALEAFAGSPPSGDLPDPWLPDETVSSSSSGSSAFSSLFQPGELRDLGGSGGSGPAEDWQPPALPDGYVLSVYRSGELLDTVLLLPGGES